MAVAVIDNASLRTLNTFGVEARTRRLVVFSDQADHPTLAQACDASVPQLILGGGSNLLLTRDLDGVTLQVATRGRRILSDSNDQVLVRAAAGENWDGFVRWSLSQGLGGLENLALIPGTVGAGPIQNIGAYGVELRQRFVSLNALNLVTGEHRSFDHQACRFGYRDSVFKRADHRAWLVLDVDFQLSRRPELVIGYADLRNELAAQGLTHPTPDDVARSVTDIRRRKLPDPARIGNAGSFFKNPVLPLTAAQELARRLPGLPVYAETRQPGQVGQRAKVSAAWLIEHCGWKGYRQGDAGVHAGHALVLVNHGHATGAELLALAHRIQASVLDASGLMLEPEPVIL